jgi:hypothetical protein
MVVLYESLRLTDDDNGYQENDNPDYVNVAEGDNSEGKS